MASEKPFAPDALDLTRFSNEDLAGALRGLQAPPAENSSAEGALEKAVRELNVYRGMLEMQNRALHDAQGELEKTQRKLEELHREQEAFNASISHDLRAPVVTILNYTRIISSEHASQLDEEGRMMLDRIERAAGRMEKTWQQLLVYRTIAREELVLESIDIADAVASLLVEHREAITAAGARITNECPGLQVQASRSILGVVLENLLSNALKFVAPGAAPEVRISAEATGDLVVVKVTDHGIGIEPKFHPRIFQIFQRLHGYKYYPGTGLGLAIARRGIERMSGRVWVESEPGKGSCFHFELRKG